MTWVQHEMETAYDCVRVAVPLPTDTDAVAGEPQCDVFVSRDYDTNRGTLMLVIQGSGAVRPGVWSRKAVINEGLDVRGLHARRPPSRASSH
jgi:hypothetical protein